MLKETARRDRGWICAGSWQFLFSCLGCQECTGEQSARKTPTEKKELSCSSMRNAAFPKRSCSLAGWVELEMSRSCVEKDASEDGVKRACKWGNPDATASLLRHPGGAGQPQEGHQ